MEETFLKVFPIMENRSVLIFFAADYWKCITYSQTSIMLQQTIFSLYVAALLQGFNFFSHIPCREMFPLQPALILNSAFRQR